MGKGRFLIAVILVTIFSVPASAIAQPLAAAKLPVVCKLDGPEVYLVIDETRRHIVNWETFLDLGYTTADIAPCGDAAHYPEGQRVTHLLKGTSDRVYLMERGLRRHIPEMDTFNQRGFHVSDITVLPDPILRLWPLGKPLAALSPLPAATVDLEFPVGQYKIKLWRPLNPTYDIRYYATISAPNRPDIVVRDLDKEGVGPIGHLPVADVTGDGYPDVLFFTRIIYSGHCCWGSILYSLGPVPVQALNIVSTAYNLPETGRGEFADLNGDGRYELIVKDPLLDVGCSMAWVTAIAEYDPVRQYYVGASPKFPSFYAAQNEQFLKSFKSNDNYCWTTFPYIASLLLLGKTDEARAAFIRFVATDPTLKYWGGFQEAVRKTRFYVLAR